MFTDPTGLRGEAAMISDLGTKTDSQCIGERLEGIQRDIEILHSQVDSNEPGAAEELRNIEKTASEVRVQYIDALNNEEPTKTGSDTSDWGIVFAAGFQGSAVAVSGPTAGVGLVAALGSNGFSFGGYGSFNPTFGSPNIAGGVSALVILGTSDPYVIATKSYSAGGSIGVSAGPSLSIGGDYVAFTDINLIGLSISGSIGVDIPGFAVEGHISPYNFSGYQPFLGVKK